MNDQTPSVLYGAIDGVATIRLNRPQVLNAFNESMLVLLAAALQRARDDKNVRAVLLTGNGRGFCAGAELLREQTDDPPDAADTLRRLYHPVILGMRQLAKPVVVAVNGVAAGAGMSLALAGDIIVASRDASFCAAFARVGLIPDAGCTYFLPRLAGDMRARALAMLAERIGAEEAQRQGLVWKVTASEALDEEARQVASKLAAMPTRALGLIKQAFDASDRATLEEQLELEAELQSVAARTHDFSEGVAAFIEKRTPAFRGC